MRHILISVLAYLLFIGSATAQSYDHLWKKVQAASQDDLPQTALSYTRQIRNKALTEGNDAQLLKAVLMERVCHAEISPDSAKACTRRMEQALAGEHRPVQQALWHTALSRIYADAFERSYAYSSADRANDLSQAILHARAALAHPEALADASTDAYLSLFVQGHDSRYFNNDLLHVVYQAIGQNSILSDSVQTPERPRLTGLYRSRGNADAVLLLTIDSIQTACPVKTVTAGLADDSRYRALLALARQYETRPLNVRSYELLVALQGTYDSNNPQSTANDSLLLALARQGVALYGEGREKEQANGLRNFITRMELPSARLERLSLAYLPGDKADFILHARHLRQVSLRITPLCESRADFDRYDSKQRKEALKRGRKQATVHTFDIPQAAAWIWQQQNEAFAIPEKPGVYHAELMFDGRVCNETDFSVSEIHPLLFATAGRQNRVTVLDARSGHPLPGATVTAYDSRENLRQIQVFTADENGQLLLGAPRLHTDAVYYATAGTDRASLAFSLTNYGYAWGNGNTTSQTATYVNLFADRAIYRPGQQVRLAGVAYTRHGDDYQAQPNLDLRVALYNVNRKAIDTLRVRTDEWGAFDGTFKLPEAVLPGNFLIEAQGPAQRGTLYIKVEEYKRPTFTAETLPVQTAYALGDTVRVEGVARTYSGVPVSGAKVAYTVRRASWMMSGHGPALQTGTTTTDAQGRFFLPIVLQAGEDERRPLLRNSFYYRTEYAVTADNGETVQGTSVLCAAAWQARLQMQVPEQVAKEQMPHLVVNQYNAAGLSLTANGTYTLSCNGLVKQQGTFVTGRPLETSAWSQLPSGNYELAVTTPQARPDTARFVLFAESDTRPADRLNTLFAYSRLNEAGDEAVIRIGTKAPHAILFYDLLANGRTVESRRIALSDSLFHLNLRYRPEYGDGAKAFFAMVKDDKLYTFTAQVEKPTPDKRLLLHWTSFRSRLTPGAQEEWRLQVTRPDSTPAQALVLARMYDASLDAFAQERHAFSNIWFGRVLPTALWSWTENRPGWGGALGGTRQWTYLKVPTRTFTQWQSSLFNYQLPHLRFQNEVTLDGAFSYNRPQMRTSGQVALTEAVPVTAVKERKFAKAESADTNHAPSDESAGAGGGMPDVTPRTNFAETAFFMPHLVTDERGEVSLSFTLPESMTTWNFSALAHDRQMNHGSLDTTLVARKDFMVEPALPRFVRRGDRTTLPVKVTNLTDREIKTRLAITLTDAMQEGKPLYSKRRTIKLAAGESRVYGFDYEATTESGVLICRTVAEGSGFSDGEEHYLPVLDDRVEVTRTLPFSLTKQGRYDFKVDTLFNSSDATHRSLTVELSSNPLWYAVTALPALAGNSNCLSATEWATRYYALALGLRVARLHPEVRRLAADSTQELAVLSKLKLDGMTDATPWLRQAENEAQRGEALRQLFDEEMSAVRRYTAIDKLKALQRADGSWSWYPGMPGNAFITANVAIALARVQKLAADQAADGLLLPAYSYLKKEIARQVAEMKKEEKQTPSQLPPSEWQMQYLYLRCLLGERPDADAKYLTNRAIRLRKELTMYGKAVMAIVLAETGHEDEAKLNLQSLMEHTVGTPEMGRYFDTPRAEWSWRSYRIPTQCAAIEALQYFGRDREAADLRLWLLQAKRTQMWETSRASADAVYALLTAKADSASLGSLAQGGQTLWLTLKKGRDIVGINASKDTQTPATVGYTRQTFTQTPAVDATTLTVRKDRDGLSWGSAYATFMQPESQVKAEGKGLAVTQRIEVSRNGRWTPLSAGEVLAQGDRIRRTFTVTADRDYDFVSLEAARAACLNPAHPLSGYQWGYGLPAYRAVTDAMTTYFIEQVRKGTHELTEELYADRAGIYAMGLTRITCVYAPEFTGTAASMTITAR